MSAIIVLLAAFALGVFVGATIVGLVLRDLTQSVERHMAREHPDRARS